MQYSKKKKNTYDGFSHSGNNQLTRKKDKQYFEVESSFHDLDIQTLAIYTVSIQAVNSQQIKGISLLLEINIIKEKKTKIMKNRNKK